MQNQIPKDVLENLYLTRGYSMHAIAEQLKCSVHKISYWMHRHKIQRRTISDAIYLLKNPNGDPFSYSPPTSLKSAILFGFGLGLYWGEGTKASKNSIKLGNTNPLLIRKFIDFLCEIFHFPKEKLRFGLQIFSDIKPEVALDYWQKSLNVSKSQFQKPIVTLSGSISGTYRNKCKYGVVTVQAHNKKLRDLLISLLPT